MRTVRFGIIGGGMMGREFASVAARWLHLPEMTVRPEIVALCNRTLNTPKIDWFRDNIPTLRQVTSDYRELLANPEVEAVYIAVPHHLHEEFYVAALEAGKHLMGEKPFGIDRQANEAIMAAVERHPECFVRCASQFIFFPAVQRIGRMLEAGAFGQIIEANAGFLHGSDLDPHKPINWKRVLKYNGAYGCMGDLGPHVCAIPLRAGWIPKNVRAVLSNIMRERPDGKGGVVPCQTWDNATLLCEAEDPASGSVFPLTLRTERIAPGEKNNWYLEIYGTRASARYSLKDANALELLEYTPGTVSRASCPRSEDVPVSRASCPRSEGGTPSTRAPLAIPEPAWRRIDLGHEMTYNSITGKIFQAGVSDVILQMWAAFMYEFDKGETPGRFAGCVTPAESVTWHKLFTAALESQAHHTTKSLQSLG
jgi:predicted dehydrogenase